MQQVRSLILGQGTFGLEAQRHRIAQRAINVLERGALQCDVEIQAALPIPSRADAWQCKVRRGASRPSVINSIISSGPLLPSQRVTGKHTDNIETVICVCEGVITNNHINLFYSDEDAGWIADISGHFACSAFGDYAGRGVARGFNRPGDLARSCAGAWQAHSRAAISAHDL
jgi:hypothetical protein